MALASKQKVLLNNIHTDYTQILPFKGQQNPGRYLPLSHVHDHKQLRNIRNIRKRVERVLAKLMAVYGEDAEGAVEEK